MRRLDPGFHIAGISGFVSANAVFRRAQSFCTSSTFNPTNAASIRWAP
jgi:hypothetical protein